MPVLQPPATVGNTLFLTRKEQVSDSSRSSALCFYQEVAGKSLRSSVRPYAAVAVQGETKDLMLLRT
jgi:hypothetical protein